MTMNGVNNKRPRVKFLWRNNEEGKQHGRVENCCKTISGLNTIERDYGI